MKIRGALEHETSDLTASTSSVLEHANSTGCYQDWNEKLIDCHPHLGSEVCEVGHSHIQLTGVDIEGRGCGGLG